MRIIYLAKDYAEETEASDDVGQKLADIVNQLWSSKLEENKLKEKTVNYDGPKNCEKLALPKVNPEIFGLL